MGYTFLISSTDRFLFILFSYACRRYPSTQSMASERWRLPLFRGMCSHYIAACTLNLFTQGQCWCNCQPQGRNERFGHHWPRSKRMCASISLHTFGVIALLTNHFLLQRIGGPMASYCIKCWHCRINEIMMHHFPFLPHVQIFFPK